MATNLTPCFRKPMRGARSSNSVLRTFDISDLNSLVTIWNAACGINLAITPRVVEYNTRASTGAIQAGQVWLEQNKPVGFVLASALPNDPQTSPRDLGWIDAIAVAPELRRRAMGSELLAWAEEWLREQGCARVRLGGGLRPFTPGYPTELGNLKFFTQRGYAPRPNSETVWDVARDLANYPTNELPNDLTIRPATQNDISNLRTFFAREFPNRWLYEYAEFLRGDGRISDYLVLVTSRGVDGFGRITLEDSERPIERFYPRTLARPWGQLGPLGISKDARGKGLGGALLDGALQHLRNLGVRGCVIDWTDLVGFYRKFGFTPHREYAMLLKTLR